MIPKGIGGNVRDNPFVSNNVCRRCNNVTGIFIDAPFVKAALINDFRFSVARDFIRPEEDTVVPLSYMGVLRDTFYEDKICEVYLGPTGDPIYHFHSPYPHEEVAGIVGVPPHVKKKGFDKGFAFLFLRTNNPEWIPTVFYSFISYFKGATLYFGNGPVPDVDGARFEEIPEQLNSLHQELLLLLGKSNNVRKIFSMDADHRFMAKLALGFGDLFLESNFIDSPDADLLRKFMRERDPEKRKQIPVRGGGILGNTLSENVKNWLNWSWGHIFYVLPTKEALILYCSFYGQLNSIIQIAADQSLWNGIVDENGMAYVIVPERQKCVGPVAPLQLIAHLHTENKIPELHKIELDIQNYVAPPYVVEDGIT